MSHREVMQQALEAIRIFREWEMGQDYESCRATVLARALAAEESLGAALAEPTCKDDLQVEPVAWMDVDDRGNMLSLRFWSEGGHEEVPLYTHPAPQRQPLTDEEIVDIWADVSIDYDDEINIIELARAIEQAHGIGGQDDTR